MSTRDEEHVQFLNAFYSGTRHVYDATRKFFLFGRDALLQEIASHAPRTVVEVGCGTGRNLALLRRQLPETRFAALEPCDSMREFAQRRHPWIVMADGFAEHARLQDLLSCAPEVIFFSYSLSMVQDKNRALHNCLQAVAPHGRVYVLDFADLRGLGRASQRLFHGWLRLFHVFPEDLTEIWSDADEVVPGRLSYWKRALYHAR